MLHPELQAAVSKMIKLNKSEWQLFNEAFVHRSVPKKFNLLEPGQVAREAYFVVKGATRLYYLKDGEDISANFIFENGFITSLESFLLRTPSRQGVDTLEDTELLVITKEKLDALTLPTLFSINSRGPLPNGVLLCCSNVLLLLFSIRRKNAIIICCNSGPR